MTSFTYRAARSGALLGGLALAVSIEMLVVQLWLGPQHPVIAWTLTVGALGTLAWLVADYRALGHGALRLTGGTLEVAIGQRGAAVVPLALVAAAVVRPTWREVPAAGTSAAAEYMNLLKPASPNVLVTLTAPVSVRLLGGVRRRVRQFGFCVDTPDAFIAALCEARASESQPAAT